MTHVPGSKYQASSTATLAETFEKPRPELVPALAKRLRRVVDHRLLERILRQSEKDLGID
mgnify:FL=1